MCSGEHNLTYYALFQDYLGVYEVSYKSLSAIWKIFTFLRINNFVIVKMKIALSSPLLPLLHGRMF